MLKDYEFDRKISVDEHKILMKNVNHCYLKVKDTLSPLDYKGFLNYVI
jgi:hypothetical protein